MKRLQSIVRVLLHCKLKAVHDWKPWFYVPCTAKLVLVSWSQFFQVNCVHHGRESGTKHSYIPEWSASNSILRCKFNTVQDLQQQTSHSSLNWGILYWIIITILSSSWRGQWFASWTRKSEKHFLYQDRATAIQWTECTLIISVQIGSGSRFTTPAYIFLGQLRHSFLIQNCNSSKFLRGQLCDSWTRKREVVWRKLTQWCTLLNIANWKQFKTHNHGFLAQLRHSL